VLLVKNGATWQDVNVLAAIDPAHALAKPTKLDSRILATAATFANALNGSLHVVHSYTPVPAGTVPMVGGASSLVIEEIAKASERRARGAFIPAIAQYRLPRSRQHLVKGLPFDTIPEVADEIGSGLVVMGAVSRSGLKRIFIGNTAERLLNHLKCDVLVVKPAEFKARVQPRRKGMHFVGLPGVGEAYF
jgi:universal stress protein E